MLEKLKRSCSMLLLLTFILTSIPTSVFADEIITETNDSITSEVIEDETIKNEDEDNVVATLSADEEEGVNVATWKEFYDAYNNSSVSRINLKADISGNAPLIQRRNPVIISGYNKDKNFKLDLGNFNLPVNMPVNQTIKIQDLIVANNPGTEGAFIEADGYSYGNIHVHNIKSEISEIARNGESLMRVANGFSSTLIISGNIDVKIRREFARPGAVKVLDEANFKSHQENTLGYADYSMFWFIASGLKIEDRYFKVGNNVKINWTRDRTSDYPPVYHNYSSIDVGNNVIWNQDNYLHFISNQTSTTDTKTIKFGKRSQIKATNSRKESIDFGGSKENYVEFGPGSSLRIMGKGDLIVLGKNSKVIFRNPVGLDLETTDGSIFNMSSGGKTEFQYITLSTWNNDKDVSTSGPASAEFTKVTNAVLEGGGTKAISNVTSDNNKLVQHFKANNSKRVISEKIPTGEVGIQYINQEGSKVGDPVIINYDKEVVVVDEEIEIPESLRSTDIPPNYHYATTDELKSMGKTQPEYAYTGMEGVNDPRITEMYIHGDSNDIMVNFVNVKNNKVAGTAKFTKTIGQKLDLSENEFTSKIPVYLHYASNDELKEGQEQSSSVVVEKDGVYTVYVAEDKIITDSREEAKEAVKQAAKDKIAEINAVPGATKEGKQTAIDKVNEYKDDALTKLDEANSVEQIQFEKKTGIDNINGVPLPDDEIVLGKAAAEKAIKEAATKKRQEIEDVLNPVESEKIEALEKVDKEEAEALGEIDKAKTVETIEAAKDNGIKAIEGIDLPRTKEALAKEEAIKAIEDAATKKNKEIDDVLNPVDIEKDEALKKVVAERTKALGEIDKATTVDTINKAKDNGVEAIESIELPKTKEAASKEEAIKAIEEAVAKKNKEINDVLNPVESEKDEALKKVIAERTKALGEIDKAITVDTINEAMNTGVTAIESIAIPKTKEAASKEAAIKAIEEEVAKKRKEINDVLNPVESEKENALAKLQAERDNALGEIDKAETVETIEAAKDNGIKAIQDIELPRTKEAVAKEEAVKAIEEAAKKKIEDINNVENPIESERDDALEKVENEKVKALEEIDKATTVDTINKAKDNGIEAIEKVELPRSGVQINREDAKAAVNEAAIEKNAEINGIDGTLASERQEALAKVEAERIKAHKEIDKADTKETIEKARDEGIAAIKAVKNPRTPEEREKDKSKTEIDEAAEKKIREINAVQDPDLGEKASALKEVEKEKEAAYKAVDGAGTQEEIWAAKREGIAKIEAIKAPRTILDKARDEGKKEIDDAAKKKIEDINKVPGATEEDKKEAEDKVKEIQDKAKEDIDKGTTVKEVEEIVEKGKEDINKVPLPKTPEEKALDKGKKEIDKAAEEKKAEINGVENPEPTEKANALREVDKEKALAYQNIDSGKTVKEIEDATATGVAAIKAIKKPRSLGEIEITVAKEEAINAVNKAATDKNAEINAVEGALQQDREEALRKVEIERAKAVDSIKASTTDTVKKVNAERDKGIAAIKAVENPKSAKELQVERSKKAIDEAAEAKIKAINAVEDPEATELLVALAKVESEKKAAYKAIDEAPTVETIVLAQAEGVNRINAIELPRSKKDVSVAGAIDRINKEAEKRIGEINNVSGALEADKLLRIKEVNSFRDQAITAIKNAPDSERVAIEEYIGTENIRNVPLPLSGLQLAKEEAIKQINEAATAKLVKINSVIEPDEQELKEARDKVEAERTKAIDNVKASESQNQVDVAKVNGIAAIEKIANPRSKMDDTKNTAIDELEKAAKKRIAEINAVEGAKLEDVNSAIKQVNTYKDSAILNVNKATTSYQVIVAKETGIKNIESVPLPKGTTEVDISRENAINDINQAADKKIDDIYDVEGADSKEVKQLKDRVNKEREEAIANIKISSTLLEVKNSRKDGLDKIAAVPLPESGLSKEKTKAKDEVEQAAKNKIAEIDKILNPDPAAKKAAIDAVNNYKENALKAIDKATDIRTVVEEKNTGIKNINSVENPKSGLEIAKDAAKDALEEKAKDKISKIESVPGATEEEKQKAIDKVNEFKDEAIKAVEDSETEKQVETEKKKGIDNIESVELPPSSLDKAKENAKKVIEEKAKEKTIAIKASEGADKTEVENAIKEVQKHEKDAYEAIDKATTVEKVADERDLGVKNIDSVKIPKSALDKSKENAIEELNKKAAEKIEEIKAVKEPKPEDVTRAIDEVIAERDKAIKNVNNSGNAEGVKIAKDEGIKAIDAVKLPLSGFELDKITAKNNVQEAANKRISEINGVTDATQADAQKAKDLVNRYKDEAFANIDRAKTGYELRTAETEGIKKIQEVPLPLSVLAVSKDEAKKAIDDAAKKKIEIIESIEGAKKEDVDKAISEVNKHKEDAKKKIEEAKTVVEVESEKQTGITNINNVENPKSGLENAKDDSKKAIDKKAEEKIKEIESVPGATEEDKKKAVDEVKEIQDKAKDDIDDATTIDKVKEIEDKGKTDIDNVELPASSLDRAKEAAKKEIEEAAAKKLADIDAVLNPNLEEKAKAIDAVNKYKDEALKEIRTSETVKEVTTARDIGLNNIKGVKLPSTLEEIAKEAAYKAIEQAAKEKRAEIEEIDAYKADRDVALAKVEEERVNAISNIEKADTVSKVETARDEGIAAIKAVPNPKTIIQINKEKSIANVKAAAEMKIASFETIINPKPEDKQKAIDQVNKFKDDAIEAINKANDITSVINEENIGIENINSVKAPKSGLDNGKDDGKKEIDDKAEEKIKEIEDRDDVDQKDKDKAIEDVEKERDKAKEDIDNSKTEEEVKEAVEDGKDAIDKVEPVTKLDRAREKAYAEIDEAVKEKLAEINGVINPVIEEKEEAIKEVQKQKDLAYNNIEKATTIKAVEKAAADGVEAIKDIEKPRTVLEKKKDDGKTEIDGAAEDKIKEIKDRDDVDQEDKDKAIDDVNKEREKAKEDIDNSETTKEVDKAVEDGKEAIDKVNPPTIVDKAKEKGKEEIDDAADKKIEDIKKRDDVDQEDKDKAIDDVNKEREKAKENIDDSTTVKEVEKAVEDGKEAIDKINPPTIVDKAKEKGKEDIDEAAKKKNEEIDNVPGATDEDKQTAKDKVKEIQDKAKEDIDKSTTVKEVEDTVEKGIEDINNVELPKTGLAVSKEEAKQAINKKAEEKSAQINAVEQAKKADVEKALTKVEEERIQALDNIDVADTVEKVEKAKTNGIAAIDAVPLPKSGMERGKEDAKARVQEAANRKNEEIERVEYSMDEDVADAKAKVNAEKDKAFTSIDNSESVYEIIDARDKGIEAINNIPLPEGNVNVPKAKDDSYKAIDEAAEKRIKEIKEVEDATLEDVEKSIREVNKERDRAKENIDNSTTVLEVLEERDKGIKAIENVPLPKSGLDRYKDVAKAKVQAAADKKNKEIEAVRGASYDDIQVAKTKVEKEKNLAFDAIDLANKERDIDIAKDTGILNIEKVELPKENLAYDIAKEEAIKAINKAADIRIVRISGVAEAIEAEVEEAIAKVELEREKALKEIEKTGSISSVEEAVKAVVKARNEGITSINNVALPSSGLDRAKELSKAKVEEAAKIKLEAIDAVEGAKLEDRKHASDLVNEYKNEALEEIENSTSTYELITAETEGIKNINKVPLPKSALDIDKDKAKEEIDKAADDKIEKIKEGDATDEDKQKAIDDVNNIRDKAKEAIDKSETQDQVNREKDKGLEEIEAVEIPKGKKNAIVMGGAGTVSLNVELALSKKFDVERISGNSRYGTAAGVSKKMYPDGAKTVVLASGQQYSDELTATVYANAVDAPVLLTRAGDIPEDTMKEIQRLKASNVVIIGGKGTISQGIENSLKANHTVERISGANRYETAVVIARQLKSVQGKDIKEVALVDGTNFPDAISMTSYAVNRQVPILLTQPGSLRAETENLINQWGVTKVTIGGGTGSVSQAIENKINSRGTDVTRLAGANRYDTSVVVAKEVYGNVKNVVVASGQVFPDAVVGAPLAASKGYPIVLVRSNDIPEAVKGYINK